MKKNRAKICKILRANKGCDSVPVIPAYLHRCFCRPESEQYSWGFGNPVSRILSIGGTGDLYLVSRINALLNTAHAQDWCQNGRFGRNACYQPFIQTLIDFAASRSGVNQRSLHSTGLLVIAALLKSLVLS